MDNPGKTKQHWNTQDENDQNNNTLQGCATRLMTKGKLDIMLTKFIHISFEINSCHKSGRHFPI